MKHIYDFVSGPLLYGSTFMLGLLLGVLCDAHLLLDPKILKLLVLGMGALLLSGIGGIIEGTSCTSSSGQLQSGHRNCSRELRAYYGEGCPEDSKQGQPQFLHLGRCLGANISGVITSAIITGIYITIIPYL